jgi:hypothetical protein
VKRPIESEDVFCSRINAVAIDDEERIVSNDKDADWLMGKKNRHKGLLHSDIWVNNAVELASRGVLGVYPSLGWWKTRPAL